MLLLLPKKQIDRIFSVRETLLVDPVNNPDLTAELYEEMLEFEQQLYGREDQDTPVLTALGNKVVPKRTDEQLIL